MKTLENFKTKTNPELRQLYMIATRFREQGDEADAILSELREREQIAPDGKPFGAGTIRGIQTVGVYDIVCFEHDTAVSTAEGIIEPEDRDAPLWMPYVRGQRTGHVFHTVEGAVAFGIAYAVEGANTKADRYFLRGLDSSES